MQTLRVGIIGAGYIGKEHARALRLVCPFFDGQLEIAAIADANIEAAKHAAREFDIPRASDSIDSVLNDPTINVIFVCLPTKFHLETIRTAVANGKHIFCEKPFARNIEDARAVHELLTKSPMMHQVGFVLRFAPHYHALAKILSDLKKRSPLRSISLRDDQCLPIHGREGFTPWRSDADLAGAGVLIEHGIHDIDVMEWLFGRIKNVSARSSNFAGYAGIEDYMEVRFQFEDGLPGNMMHMWHNIPAHQEIRHFEIFLNDALITMDRYDMDRITVRDHHAETTYDREDLYALVKEHPLFVDLAARSDIVFRSDFYAIQDYWFIRSLLDGKKPFPSIDEGLRAFEIAAACYRSASQDSARTQTN